MTTLARNRQDIQNSRKIRGIPGIDWGYCNEGITLS